MREDAIVIGQKVKENLFESCRSLGKTIFDSDENIRFNVAQDKFRQDDEARAILRDYNTSLSEYQKKSQWSGASDEEYKKLEEKNKTRLKNETLKNYFESQQALISLCKEINEYASEKLKFNFALLAKPQSNCCS